MLAKIELHAPCFTREGVSSFSTPASTPASSELRARSAWQGPSRAKMGSVVPYVATGHGTVALSLLFLFGGAGWRNGRDSTKLTKVSRASRLDPVCVCMFLLIVFERPACPLPFRDTVKPVQKTKHWHDMNRGITKRRAAWHSLRRRVKRLSGPGSCGKSFDVFCDHKCVGLETSLTLSYFALPSVVFRSLCLAPCPTELSKVPSIIGYSCIATFSRSLPDLEY